MVIPAILACVNTHVTQTKEGDGDKCFEALLEFLILHALRERYEGLTMEIEGDSVESGISVDLAKESRDEAS